MSLVRGIFIDRQVPSILAGVSLILNALVTGNGSYILRAYGHDLHGPTVCTAQHEPLVFNTVRS